MNAAATPFIRGAGGCITSLNCVEGRGRVKFAVRESSVNAADNGWRVFSEFDTDEYVNDTSNLIVVDYNTICDIEPAMIAVWDMPVGSDIEIIKEPDGRTRIYDHASGRFVMDS